MRGDFGPFSIINISIHLCYETSNLHNHIRKREMGTPFRRTGDELREDSNAAQPGYSQSHYRTRVAIGPEQVFKRLFIQ
jgi:hypothetical protein